jgi:hypothetical protein
MAMVELFGRENLKVTVVEKNDRQIDSHSMLLAIFGFVVTDMPCVGVGDVSNDN